MRGMIQVSRLKLVNFKPAVVAMRQGGKKKPFVAREPAKKRGGGGKITGTASLRKRAR